MVLLDGKKIAADIKQEIKEEVLQLQAAGKKTPHLAAILVGNNPASEAYVANKVKSCKEVGFDSTLIKLENNATEEEVLANIQQLNEDAAIDGFIVQLPLPKHFNEEKILLAIHPEKDVDGFHPLNVGRMVLNLPAYVSATPKGILEIIKRYNIETEGKRCVVIGRSNIVGLPMSILMGKKNKFANSTVVLCHSKTNDLKAETLQADIIIAALGIPQFLKADMVKEGAVVIDVGISRIEDSSRKSGFRLVGDVDFEEVSKKCSYITPVPGGIGLMTVASLMQNTLSACKKEFY